MTTNGNSNGPKFALPDLSKVVSLYHVLQLLAAAFLALVVVGLGMFAYGVFVVSETRIFGGVGSMIVGAIGAGISVASVQETWEYKRRRNRS